MRLQQFINETYLSTENWEHLKGMLEKDCKPYIKELKGAKKLLLRGMKKYIEFYEIKNVRKNRKPRLIDKNLHIKLDNELNKIFGWKVRSQGLFTTTGKDVAKRWGDPCIVFPIGKFKYIWIDDTHDLYYGYDVWFDGPAGKGKYKSNNEKIWDKYIYPSINKYHDTDLNKFLKMPDNPTDHASECIIKCNKYYAINYEWYYTLLEYFGNRYKG